MSNLFDMSNSDNAGYVPDVARNEKTAQSLQGVERLFRQPA